MQSTATHLSETIARALPLLRQITDADASLKPAPGKWSPKKIIGHLIDSATNNQRKFIRCMEHDGAVVTGYEQDFWVAAQRYNEASWEDLLRLWEALNHHIAHIISGIPAATLGHTIVIDDSGSFTLEFIVRDYPEHLKHHLKSLFPSENFLKNSFRMVY